MEVSGFCRIFADGRKMIVNYPEGRTSDARQLLHGHFLCLCLLACKGVLPAHRSTASSLAAWDLVGTKGGPPSFHSVLSEGTDGHTNRRLPSRKIFCSIRSCIVFLPTGCAAVSLYLRARRILVWKKDNTVMQQSTINFGEVLPLEQKPATVNIVERVKRGAQVVNHWLDSRSEFYSRMLGEDISWRKSLRVGVVLPLLFVVVFICSAQAPLVTMASLSCAAWIAYRLNAEEEAKGKKGGKR